MYTLNELKANNNQNLLVFSKLGFGESFKVATCIVCGTSPYKCLPP